jgi:hypothetical protein
MVLTTTTDDFIPKPNSFDDSSSSTETMVLKTGLGRKPERIVVPVLVVRPGSDRWSNR